MSRPAPTVLCICLFKNRGRILVSESRDRVKNETYYRPLGGAMEFGERGHQTIAREIMEEIGAEVTNVSFIGTLENIFTLEGKPWHQIVLVYDGDFVDKSFYLNRTIQGHDEWPGGSADFKAMWKPIDYFRKTDSHLYPEGLFKLIRRNRQSAR